MKFDRYMFISPPRPEKAIPIAAIGGYKGGQWFGQAKLNGTYNVIFVTPEKEVSRRKRDGSEHHRWKPDAELIETLGKLKGNGWYVFCAELLNDKTPHIKNVNYIHDMLVDNGELLVGVSFFERWVRVRCAFTGGSLALPNQRDMYQVLNDSVWLANVWSRDFGKHYHELIQRPEVEGLVLKSNMYGFSVAHPGRGQVKIRKPHKNYGY